MTEHCANCGELCCGKLDFNIEVRKGSVRPFCTNCFNQFRYINVKEIRKILKLNKYGVTC